MIDPKICATCEWAGRFGGSYIHFCDHLCRTGKRKEKEVNGRCPSYVKRDTTKKRKKRMDYIFAKKE